MGRRLFDTRIVPRAAQLGLSLCLALLAGLFSLLVRGSDYGHNPYHAQQLPLLERLADPAAYPGDYYVDTARELPSLLGRALAALPGGTGAKAFFALHLGSRLAAFAAFWYLSFSLTGSAAGAALGSLLLAAAPQLHTASPLARDLFFRCQFDLSAAAAPFLLLGLAGWFGDGPRLLAGSLACAAFANPLSALLLLAACAAAGLLELAYYKGQGEYARRLGPAVLLAVLALAVLLARGPEPELGPALAIWFPAHYFAGSWSAPHLAWGGASLLLAFAGLRAAAGVFRGGKRLAAFSFGLTGLWLFYYCASLLLPGTVLLSQLYRADSLLWLVFLALLGPLAAHAAANGGTLLLAAAGGLCAVSPLAGPAWLAAAAALLALAAYRPAAALSLPVPAGLAAPLRTALLAAALTIGLDPWLRTAAERGGFGVPAAPAEAEAAGLGAWAAAATKPADVFFTPPGESLRLALRRPVVFEWTDGAAAHWSPGFAAAWLARARDYGVDPAAAAAWWLAADRDLYGAWTGPRAETPAAKAFRSMDEDRLAALAEKYGAKYLVAYAGMPEFRRRFAPRAAGARYRVYELKPAKAGGRRS